MSEGSPFYPDPPHLSIGIYPAGEEKEAFSAVCDALMASFGRGGGVVQTMPPGLWFEAPSDLAGVASVWVVEPDEFVRLVRGEEPTARPVRASFTRTTGELVVVELLRRNAGEKSPVGASCSAGPLGLPVALWRPEDQMAGAALAGWSKDLLRAVTDRFPTAYGAIGVELTLPTPAMLRAGSRLGSEVFVSRDLLRRSSQLRTAFDEDYEGGGEEWGNGTFYSGWAPFNSEGRNLQEVPARFAQSSKALGELLSR